MSAVLNKLEPFLGSTAVQRFLGQPTSTVDLLGAWRTREFASLLVGACYWFLKGRPYKARRIQILKPLPKPFTDRVLSERIDAAMRAYKEGLPPPVPDATPHNALHAAIAERSARRMRAAGIVESDVSAA